jgi:hypothetical protein
MRSLPLSDPIGWNLHFLRVLIGRVLLFPAAPSCRVVYCLPEHDAGD